MVRAYVLIEMAAGHSRELVNTLQGREGVRNVARVTGPYDVIVEIEAADIDAMSELVTDEIHPLAGVMRTITCVCIG
jgi:DNA-binding Lrp family transcriptional regulator